MSTTTTKTTPRRSTRRGVLAATAAVAIGIAALAGCGGGSSSSGKADATATPANAKATAEATTAAAPLTVKDPWIKAADNKMTGVFGTLVNNTDAEVTVVSGVSTASKMVELHETADVDGKPMMRPKEGGFVIPAKGSHMLKPGADHVMLMGLTKAVKPGDEVTVTLTLKDGRTVEFTAVAKAFAGGKENYMPGMEKG